MSTELEDLRDMAKTRLEELEKLNENYITSQQEKEKLKLEVCDNIYVENFAGFLAIDAHAYPQ